MSQTMNPGFIWNWFAARARFNTHLLGLALANLLNLPALPASLSIGGAPITLVMVAVTIIIGIVIIANIVPSIPSLTGAANATVTSVISTTYSSFNLMTVGLIVLAAVSILIVVRALGYGAAG